jgi:hypothetical protein
MGLIPEAFIHKAKFTDPRPLLMNYGFTIHPDGYRGHFIVKFDNVEMYRLTFLSEGRWIGCDKAGIKGDDVIGFISMVANINFRESVFALLNINNIKQITFFPETQLQKKSIKNNNKPSLPIPASRKILYSYLGGQRLIPINIIDKATDQGFLQATYDGVLFLGYDAQGIVRSVSKRAINPAVKNQKIDFKNSEKKFVPILKGDPSIVWIVEGGVDALSVHALAEMDKQTLPTVIVSGGARNTAFLESSSIPPTVRNVLKISLKIIVACEHEKDHATQQITDLCHKKQAKLANNISPQAKITLWIPPDGQGKDIADILVYRLRKL